MALGAKLDDPTHAARIRAAVDSLELAVREATADGLTIRLDPHVGRGSQRGSDRTTEYPTIAAKIWRPI